MLCLQHKHKHKLEEKDEYEHETNSESSELFGVGDDDDSLHLRHADAVYTLRDFVLDAQHKDEFLVIHDTRRFLQDLKA